MQKEAQTQFVHRLGFGKGETLSDEAAKPLPQSVVPSLDVRRQPGLFTRRRVLLRRDDQRVGFPKVAVAMSATIALRYLLPEFATGRRTSIANHVSDDLPRGTAQGDPNPAFVGTLCDK